MQYHVVPVSASYTGLALMGEGARLNGLDVWQMRPTWP